jgi:hypothetical protein
MAFDLQRAVDRYKSSAAQGATRYAEGIQATNVTASITSGRWARGLSQVGTAGWKSAALAKQQNYAVGIQAGGDKYASAMQTWGPLIDAAANQAKQMPNATFQDSLNRMTAFATALHNAKLSR